MQDFLSIKGNFETSSVPEILFSIFKDKETGILKCTRLGVEKLVYLHEGKIVFATSSDPDDRLGESLLKYGDISMSQFIEASKLITPERRLGTILCDMNAITPDHLLEGLKRQVIDVVYSIFQWKTGDWELILTDLEDDKIVLFNISMEKFIFDGVRQINYLTKILNGLSSIINSPIKTPDADRILMNVNLDPDENHVLSLCNGNYDIQAICNLSYLSNLETCKIIWAFKAIGAVTFISKGIEQKESKEDVKAEYELMDIVESYNDIMTFIYDFVSNKCSDNVDEIINESLKQINSLYENRLTGMDLNYGRVDLDSLLQNFSDLSGDDRKNHLVDILEELVYTLIIQSKTFLSSTDHKLLFSEIARLKG